MVLNSAGGSISRGIIECYDPQQWPCQNKILKQETDQTNPECEFLISRKEENFTKQMGKKKTWERNKSKQENSPKSGSPIKWMSHVIK